MASVTVLGNPTGRRGQAQLHDVTEAFERAGVNPDVIAARTVADSRVAARRAVADGATRLVAVGGDGVANIALDAAAESETVLGIVPLGTGNDFARALGLRDGGVDH